MANKQNMGGPWGKAESDLPGDTPVDPIAPASIPEPAPTAEPDASRPSFASAASQFGRDYLRRIYPEFYSGDRSKAQSAGDEGSSESIRNDMALIQKALDDSDKRDQQYRRDVNDLKTRLTATDVILKNNTDLLRQEVMLQTRTIAILHELAQAQRGGGGAGGVAEAVTGAGIFEGIGFLASFLPKQLTVAIAIIMNLKQTMDSFKEDYEKYHKEYEENKAKQEVVPGFSEHEPDPRDYLPENQYKDNPVPVPDVHKESYVIGGDSSDSNVIKLQKLEFDADTLTFESEKFTFKHTGGESSHYSGMSAGQYGQAASGIQLAAYHPEGGALPIQTPATPGVTPNTGGIGLGSILGGLGGLGNIGSMLGGLGGSGGLGSLLGGLGGGKGLDLGALAASPLGQSLLSNPTIAKMVAPYMAKKAAEAMPSGKAVGDAVKQYIPDSVKKMFGGGDDKGGGGDTKPSSSDIPTEGRALLDTIASTEANGKNGGYDLLYGRNNHFNNGYADHPRQNIPIENGPNKGKTTSAAGRYQFLSSTWDEEAKRLGLKDFSPENQDRAAWDLAQRTYKQKTNGDLLADLKSKDPDTLARVGSALHGQWTSLPGGIEQGQDSGEMAKRYNRNLAKLSTPKETAPTTTAPATPATPKAEESWGTKAYNWLADSPINTAKSVHTQPTRPITPTPQRPPPAIPSSKSDMEADKKKIVPDSYGKPEGVNPSSSVKKPADITARAPGLNVNYYSHLYPHMYGDKAQYSPETQARTA